MKKAADYAADIAAGEGKYVGKELVLRLREMSFNIGDVSSLTGNVMVGLAKSIEKCKDKDWDRKAVREAQFFMRAMVTPDGDPKDFTLGDQIAKRGISAKHLKVALIALSVEAQHSYAPRCAAAFQTIAVLCEAAQSSGIICQQEINAILENEIILRLHSYTKDPRNLVTGLLERMKMGQDWSKKVLSRSLFSALRRSPGLSKDPKLLSCVLAGCSSSDPVTTRHAFAVLKEQALTNVKNTARGIQRFIERNPLPNLDDSLACIYYLQSLRVLVFSPEVETSTCLDLYCRILRYAHNDKRDVVALEAICCLMEHQNAWQILIDFENQLHDIDILECVVKRIHKCLQGGLHLLRGQGRENLSSVATLQAACRVCCIVGETMQRAVNFELSNVNLKGQGPKSSSSLCHGGRVFTSEPASQRNPAPVVDGDCVHSPSPRASTTPPIREQQASIDSDKTSRMSTRCSAVVMKNSDAIEELYSLLCDEGGGLLNCCENRHILCLALQAIFLITPAPNPADATITQMWTKLKLKMLDIPSNLPEPQLVQLVSSMLTRIDCSAATQNEIVPIVLYVAEGYMKQVSTCVMAQSLFKIWVQCIHYGDDCCGIVLESIYRILDQGGVQSTPEAAAVFISPLPSGGATTPPPQPSSTRIFHRRYSVFSRSNSGRHDVLGVRRTSQPVTSKDYSGMALDGSSDNNISNTAAKTQCSPATDNMCGESQRRRAISSYVKLRQLAFWILGKYCREFIGTVPSLHEESPKKRTTTTGGYPPPNDDDDPLPGLQESLGLQRRQHHTMSCMNENAVSLLLRLKQAVLFEDSATRHVATVALCMVALHVPDSAVCYDAYCMLKGLADIEPTVKFSGLSPLTACEAIDDASAVGLSAVVAPVVTYLESVYSAQSKVNTGNQNLSNNPKALKAVHDLLSGGS